MIFSELLQAIQSLRVMSEPHPVADDSDTGKLREIDIKSLHYRAQEVTPGGLFVAITGHTADGHDFVDMAVSNGAAAVVVEKQVSCSAPILQVHNTRAALATLAAAYYGRPSESMILTGITGTNGKTTVTYLLEEMLRAAGYSVGVIGTINYRYGGNEFKNPVTTPESLDLQHILAQMHKAGVSHVVLEVSSHALDLRRVANCWMDVGVFTNLTQDHLDYHKTLSAYWNCKKRLFTDLLNSGPKKGQTTAVLNCNDPRGHELLAEVTIPCITTGSKPAYTVFSADVQSRLTGNRGRLVTPEGDLKFDSRLVGRHNLENILSAAGAALALKIPLASIRTGIDAANRVPGRLDPVPNEYDRHVYVDYAHTPDALKNVLSSLRELADNRIICVFGCGGDRDRDKRPRMGKIAALGSDLAIVTSDNPRSEAPEAIIDQILPGIVETGSQHYTAEQVTAGIEGRGHAVEADRRQAIKLALQASNPGDSILIAGKGHEDYQILGDRTIHFDDREVAGAIMAELAMANRRPNPHSTRKEDRAGFEWSVSRVLEATGGRLLNGEPTRVFDKIEIDSRRIGSQDLFAAIIGEIHDGHKFAAEVVRSGVTGILVNEDQCGDENLKKWCKPGVAVVAVQDTTRALGDLAKTFRRHRDIPLVAITGSNGKTTTREMTASVLSQRFNTHSTKKNDNNHIGLPLTVLEIQSTHDCAVVEVGMNAPGEIDRLGEICIPDIGLIINVGPAHLEGVGSIEGVQKAKAELLPRIKPEGSAILNADDPRVRVMAKESPVETLLFGTDARAAIRAESIRKTDSGSDFILLLPDRKINVSLKVPGRFMVSNALAAATVGYQMGIDPEDIAAGLRAFSPVSGRLNILTLSNGVHLIDDTYNANPGSMRAALDTLKTLSKGNRSIFVAGDMLELGQETKKLHRQVGAWAAQNGIRQLYAAGELAGEVAQGAREAGLADDRIFAGAKKDIAEMLKSELRFDDWILIKGSRGMKMEEVVNALKSWVENQEHQ